MTGPAPRSTQGLRTGAFAEAVVVDQSQVAPIPADMPMASASLLSCGVITGVGAVVNAAMLRPGETAAIIGCGGVGLNCVQGAKIAGAATIIAIDLSPAKLQAAGLFGATDALAADRADLADQVRALTGGRGVDHCFVAVGVRSADRTGANPHRPGRHPHHGRHAPDGVTAEFDPGALAAKGQRIIGTKMGTSRVTVDIPWLVTLYEQGRLKLDELVSGEYGLEEINAAIDSVRRGEALRNVVVF